MRILVFSDIHSSKGATEMASKDINEYSPELIIISGDITHFGPLSYAEKFLSSIPVKTLAIPGNCDPPEVHGLLKKKGVDLHGKIVSIGDFEFVGLGGSNITPFSTLMEFAEDYIFTSLDKIMVERAVLITHVPPKGYVDRAPNGRHLGSEAVARIVEKYKPRIAISGHIHEARGVVKDKDTTFLNPGPGMRGYRALLDLTADKVEVELLG